MLKVKSQSVRVGKIALDRIESITVLRAGVPEYELQTTVDFEGFRNSYKRAEFFWSNGEWLLDCAVGDLQAAIIRIKP